ncbi:MAG: Ig-like domain-containing protein [Devosia sp.]
MVLKAFSAIAGAVLIGALVSQSLAATPWPAPLPSFRQQAQVLEPDAPVELEATAPAEIGEEPPTRTVTATPITPATATEAIATVLDPQPVTLTAQVTEGSGTIAEGLVWRIFDTKTDNSGQLALAAKSDAAVARVDLPPGTYVVHVAYGRAQATDTLSVVEGQNTKAVVLEAGGLRLNAAISGDVPIPINLLRFDIYTAGASESDRTLVAEDLSANDIVTLNAGTYHVISYFGTINAVVRADLKVEPGQLTDATLYHKAAQVSFRLVSEAGGEAIADVDWTVKTADGATVFSDIGAFPSTALQEGDYLVLAKRGETVFNREFQIQAGQPREIEVLTTVY